ncbi:MAG: ATP-grasp domain-containing protein [Muribaculaceae bacterium]|nr:ATP-grasp domain-containing protein [Muribaculaceae bacterium]
MNCVNILFLGGAKRVAMARLFMKAAEDRGVRCRIFSYELRRDEPIACVGSVILGKRWRDPDVIDHLRGVCADHDISIVVPFVDGAVEVAARLAAECSDIFAPTSSASLSSAMFDKCVAAELFERYGLSIPPTWNGDEVDAPLIAKPRNGSASKGIILVNKESELPADCDNYLIQRRFDRREEISIDCYVRGDGQPLAIVPRLRLEVAGGEVVRSVTIDNAGAVKLADMALRRLGLRGAVTIQLIREPDTDKLYVMEINPRLGGGAVCAVHAGADIPGMIIDEAAGRCPEKATYRPNTVIARYMQEVVFYE